MRVLAAAFADESAARRALDELRERYGLGPDDAGIAPLGDGQSGPSRVVLAGRFADDGVHTVRELLAEFGGEVVSEVDERWTRSVVLPPADDNGDLPDG